YSCQRLRDALAVRKRSREQEPCLGCLGAAVFITGGCSLLSGIDHLASEIFEIPANLTHAQTAWGVTSAVENPQFSTAIGLVKFAQVMDVDRPPRGFSRIFGRLFSGKR